MKKLVVAIFWLGLSVPVFALEVEGVKLEDKAQVENATLVLNGAGLRDVFGIIKIYVAALYLDEKKTTTEAVMADSGAKRIALHVVAGETGSERFTKGFRKGIEKNYDEATIAKLNERIMALEKIFENVKTLKKGDVVTFDWLPGVATRISLNGKELGQIKGEDFYHALLTIWIGGSPVKEGLKKELLGG